MVARQRLRRDRQRAIDAVGAGIGADRVAPIRLGRARHHRSAFGGVGRAPMQRDRALTGTFRMRGQPDVAWDQVLHVLFYRVARQKPRLNDLVNAVCRAQLGGVPSRCSAVGDTHGRCEPFRAGVMFLKGPFNHVMEETR